jgi:hypothetical protein
VINSKGKSAFMSFIIASIRKVMCFCSALLFCIFTLSAFAAKPAKEPRYFKLHYFEEEEKPLCDKVLKILHHPLNQTFSGWNKPPTATVESQTSEFKLPADEKAMRFVTWEPWENPKEASLKKYAFTQDNLDYWLRRRVGIDKSLPPNAFYRATLNFPILDKPNTYISTPLMLVQDSDVRYAERKCYMPVENPPEGVSKEAAAGFNQNEMSYWCAFFRYNGKLYKSAWFPREGSYGSLRIDMPYYDQKSGRFSNKFACQFTQPVKE